MILDCENTNPRRLYELLVSAVIPRPIAWVSSQDKDGLNNLAPFSFFNMVSVNPPVLGFSPGMKRDAEGSIVPKDTLRNIQDGSDFVVNLVSEELAEKMVQSSANYAADVSEFEKVGVTAVDSKIVTVPRVRECRVSLECKLHQIIEIGTSHLVLGRIVCIHVDDAVLRDGIIDVEKFRPVARLGAELYCIADDAFAIERP